MDGADGAARDRGDRRASTDMAHAVREDFLGYIFRYSTSPPPAPGHRAHARTIMSEYVRSGQRSGVCHVPRAHAHGRRRDSNQVPLRAGARAHADRPAPLFLEESWP